MELIVRDSTPEDMDEVWSLINELARFEKEPDAVEVTVQDLKEHGFGDNPLFHCLVAEMDGSVQGMALFYQRYSTWKGPTVHLEDLVVREEVRGKGVGSALFGAVIRYGHAKGVKRIEWAVLDWNKPAISFYESNGAVVLRDWDTVQMDENAIKNFISKN